jgi:hypothetical protein
MPLSDCVAARLSEMLFACGTVDVDLFAAGVVPLAICSPSSPRKDPKPCCSNRLDSSSLRAGSIRSNSSSGISSSSLALENWRREKRQPHASQHDVFRCHKLVLKPIPCRCNTQIDNVIHASTHLLRCFAPLLLSAFAHALQLVPQLLEQVDGPKRRRVLCNFELLLLLRFLACISVLVLSSVVLSFLAGRCFGRGLLRAVHVTGDFLAGCLTMWGILVLLGPARHEDEGFAEPGLP